MEFLLGDQNGARDMMEFRTLLTAFLSLARLGNEQQSKRHVGGGGDMIESSIKNV